MDYLPFFSLETWILLITVVCLFVVHGYRSFGVFEKLGIPGPKPVMYFGTIGQFDHVYYLSDRACAQKFGKIWGQYEFTRPTLAVVDPDMAKTILVKECFTYFTNRRNFRLNGELYDAMVFAEDDHWRRLRNALSPSFASGRIKEMFSTIKLHSSKLTAFMQSKAQNNQVVTVKDLFGPYSMDSIISCAFSVDMDTIHNPSSPLISHSSKLLQMSVIVFIFQAWFPIFIPLLGWMGVSLFPKDSLAYLKAFVEKVRGDRNRDSNQKPDILQNMINSKTAKENKGLTEHEIITQATMFVFAGYETSAITLVWLAYNLATNPEVMKRLQEEIDATFPNKGPVHYEALMQMEYLDNVVSETLRLYPVTPRLERIAKETVNINGITIPKDMLVMIPVYALQRDPEIWPEPEEFKPDRFSKENRMNINPYTYLPFGYGPRNCLGMRLALMMVKLALVEVLQNYSFSVCEETEIPLKMDPKGLVGPLRPIKLRLTTRQIKPN